jgi:hypothetical protein
MITLQYVPWHEIADLPSQKKVKKLLAMAREDKIVLVEGRLSKPEEAELIKKTMEAIDEEFKGIEIGVIYPDIKNADFMHKVRSGLAKVLLGDRHGITIIGPATIVKEIKQDPDKIQLLTEPEKKKK